MPRRSGRSRLRFGELEELAPVGFLLRTGIHHDVGLRLEGQIRQRLRSGDRGSFENRYDGGPVGNVALQAPISPVAIAHLLSVLDLLELCARLGEGFIDVFAASDGRGNPRSVRLRSRSSAHERGQTVSKRLPIS